MNKSKRSKTQKPKPEPFIGDIHFRSPHNEFPSEMRAYVEKKLMKLTRFFNTILSAGITHEEQRGYHQVSVHLDADGKPLHIVERQPDLRGAIDALFDRLEHQLIRHKERLRKGNLRRRREALRESSFASPEEAAEPSQLAEVKRMDLKPMSLEEAMLQIELLKQEFLVFRDEQTDQFCVLYRRADGHYGLMEIIG
ncbi:MAG: ribosome-associated translation inhibitor RaiA [candidate division WOR-3 bacterium]